MERRTDGKKGRGEEEKGEEVGNERYAVIPIKSSIVPGPFFLFMFVAEIQSRLQSNL